MKIPGGKKTTALYIGHHDPLDGVLPEAHGCDAGGEAREGVFRDCRARRLVPEAQRRPVPVRCGCSGCGRRLMTQNPHVESGSSPGDAK